MARATFKLSGARELDRVLQKLPREIGEKVLLSSLRVGAKEIKEAAKARAPVRSGGGAKTVKTAVGGGIRVVRQPGFLKNSIRIARLRGSESSAAVSIGPRREAFYGMFQEFGTRFQPARPWLRPALDAAAGRAIAAFGKALGKKVERAAVKLAGPLAKSGLVKRRRR